MELSLANKYCKVDSYKAQKKQDTYTLRFLNFELTKHTAEFSREKTC